MKQVSASSYCSRKPRLTMASRKCRVPRFSVYQLGRGSEPVIVVGNMMSLVARNIFDSSQQQLRVRTMDTEASPTYRQTGREWVAFPAARIARGRFQLYPGTAP